MQPYPPADGSLPDDSEMNWGRYSEGQAGAGSGLAFECTGSADEGGAEGAKGQEAGKGGGLGAAGGKGDWPWGQGGGLGATSGKGDWGQGGKGDWGQGGGKGDWGQGGGLDGWGQDDMGWGKGWSPPMQGFSYWKHCKEFCGTCRRPLFCARNSGKNCKHSHHRCRVCLSEGR
jgi:hypothetical protein